MMDEKPGSSSLQANEEQDKAFFMALLKQESGPVPLEAYDVPAERAAGDVTFTLEETCKFYLQGNNDYISEILRVAFQHKKQGKSLLQDNDDLFQALQELDEKMYYTLAALKQGLKAQTPLTISNVPDLKN